MRVRLLIAGLAAVVMASLPTSASAYTWPGWPGLWDRGHQAAVTDCGSHTRDAANFCRSDDPSESAPVELGVKFTASRPVLATGVRVYRTDDGSVTGSLWSSAGTRLATGTFAATTADGWQDLTFNRPVVIWPNRTYIASYRSPNAEYAFEYGFFSAKPHTVGPVTALQSVEGAPNGVYCYFDCFPSSSFRDTNYWVTPLWLDLLNRDWDDD